MPAPAEKENASFRSTQTLSVIESGPISPASWQVLVDKVKGQNDPLSIKSLEIIIGGLRELEELNKERAKVNEPPKQLSLLSQAMFVRLAKAYNSPTLLKEVGLIYLRDLNMPNVALQHFERSLRLGGPEKELRPLTEAAAVAVQRQLALRSGAQQGHSGITTAEHAKPVAQTVIRKTGKLLLPARFTQASPDLAETAAEPDESLAAPLPEGTEECLKQAAEAITKRQLKRATQLLERANHNPVEPPRMWQAWTDLGQAFYAAGYSAQVEMAFVEALKYGPQEMASHFNVALGQHLNGKYELALSSYLRANQIEPKHPKVWCNLGVLYFQMDQYPQAESALRYATISDRTYARAWDNLAAALGAQDKLDEAVEACERAISLRPDYPEAHFKLGVVAFSRKEYSRAAGELQRAALLPTLAAYCDCFQSMIHSRLEQTEAAEAAVRRAISTDPKCDLLWMAWNDLGLAFYAAGQYAEAANAYGEATIIKPDEPEAWFNLGVSYHRTGDHKAARTSYQQAVDLRESMTGAWHNLGIVCSEIGDLETAERAFKQELHWSPENIRAWYDLGIALDKMGRPDEARTAFEKVDQLTAATVTPAAGEPAPVSQTGTLQHGGVLPKNAAASDPSGTTARLD
jgi:tetratricopeptide (TPR) repeat protein